MLRVPQGLQLYPFQEKDCEFFIENGEGFCGSEMGTGKTPIGVVWASTVAGTRILIVCPAIMRLTWEQEFGKWTHLSSTKIEVLATTRDLPSDKCNVAICSYTYLADVRRVRKLLKNFNFDTVICDEWHYCKNWQAKRTRHILKYILPEARHKLVLTGTPITRSVTDLWTQLKPFVPSGVLGTYWDFCCKYSNKIMGNFGVEFKGIRNEEQLKEICRPFMKRRLKKNVLKELPPKVFSNIYCDIPKALADKSLEYVDIAMRQVSGTQSRDHSTDADTYLYVATIKRELGMAKVRSVVEYCSLLLETKHSLVVFAYHKDVVNTICKALDKKGVVVAPITGDTPADIRQKRVKYFQEGTIRVLVCNMIAGGVGITLTKSDHCVFAELDWTPANMSQAMDRLHRITQTNTVQVDFMLAKGSLDQQIIGSLKSKMLVAKKALGDT